MSQSCTGHLYHKSYLRLLLLERQLLVEGPKFLGSALQDLFDLNLIFTSSFLQIAAVLCTFGVQVPDDLQKTAVL